MKEKESINSDNKKSKALSWLKKIGWLGFLFFLIKGLVWVAIFLGLGKFILGE
jgi:hypothetical protein